MCVLCARTRCSVSVSVGGRTFSCCSDSQRESSERHSLKTRNSDRVCVGVIHRRSVRRTPHSSHSVCVCVFRPCAFCFFVTTEEENSCPCFLFCCSRRGRAGERGSAALRLRLFDPTGSGTFTDRLSIDLSHRVGLNRCWCFTAWTGDECCQLLIRTTYGNVFVCQSNRLPDSCWWCSCGSDWLICQLISSLIKMIINMRTVKQQQWVFDCRLCYCLLLFKPKKSQWKIFLFLLPLMLETFHCFMLFFMLFVQHLWFDSEARCFHRFKKTNLQQKTVELSVTLRWLLVWIGI